MDPTRAGKDRNRPAISAGPLQPAIRREAASAAINWSKQSANLRVHHAVMCRPQSRSDALLSQGLQYHRILITFWLRLQTTLPGRSDGSKALPLQIRLVAASKASSAEHQGQCLPAASCLAACSSPLGQSACRAPPKHHLKWALAKACRYCFPYNSSQNSSALHLKGPL